MYNCATQTVKLQYAETYVHWVCTAIMVLENSLYKNVMIINANSKLEMFIQYSQVMHCI